MVIAVDANTLSEVGGGGRSDSSGTREKIVAPAKHESGVFSGDTGEPGQTAFQGFE